MRFDGASPYCSHHALTRCVVPPDVYSGFPLKLNDPKVDVRWFTNASASFDLKNAVLILETRNTEAPPTKTTTKQTTKENKRKQSKCFLHVRMHECVNCK
jgi:hypothetical protein